MTPKSETAAQIRKDLKAIGISQRQVAVKARRGSSIDVVIKALCDEAAVRRIARSYERVNRSESTGDILCGGNMFVFIKWDSQVLDTLAAPIAAMINAADIQAGRGHRFGKDGFEFSVYRPLPGRWYVNFEVDGKPVTDLQEALGNAREAHDADGIAKNVVRIAAHLGIEISR